MNIELEFWKALMGSCLNEEKIYYEGCRTNWAKVVIRECQEEGLCAS